LKSKIGLKDSFRNFYRIAPDNEDENNMDPVPAGKTGDRCVLVKKEKIMQFFFFLTANSSNGYIK
jgi:hypothetical protein